MKSTITTYRISVSKPGMKAASVKAAFVTDLHNALWNESRDELPEIIASKKPDIILCGGDMIIARPGFGVESGLYFIRKMLKIADVYYALGNHEYRTRIYPETYGTMYADYVKPLQKEGVNFLDNTHKELMVSGCPLCLYGLTVPRNKYKRFSNTQLSVEEINEKLGTPNKEKVSILLAHNAKFYQTYLQWGADITLCGHYHGGMVRFGKHTGLLSPDLSLFPTNAYGRFCKEGKELIISAGLGEHTIPLRIGNPRELVILDIRINQ